MCDDQSHCHPWQKLYPVQRVPGGSADGAGHQLYQRWNSRQRSQREHQQREQAAAGQGETEVHQTQAGVSDPQGKTNEF